MQTIAASNALGALLVACHSPLRVGTGLVAEQRRPMLAAPLGGRSLAVPMQTRLE